ncbi:NAD(P)H-dependent flavin oxidoreductase [Paraburkholderia nemoris]|uniref:NAD(P)H-dependent flavin oxidoreductase n=1 Tax=Paraburkholderia nemoris TaxID=2793076 RepID=UPI002E282A79|nr:nitronate monooxygenase [Paraburkholderia nemoris]
MPVITAPMFLVSGPELVLAACRAGVIGTFPALNQRSTEGYADWLETIKGGLGPNDAAFGVNLIVHKTNPRLQADLDVTVRHQVPLVITSLGAVREVVDAVHGYAGLVYHDVTTLAHAKKAAERGVDGLILVCAGAGGHAGTRSPFAFVHEVRQFFDGDIILSGCLSTGRDVAAAMLLGADFAYMGTRFINTTESRAAAEYQQMIIDSRMDDVTYTPAISGIPANFLNASLVACGLDPSNLPEKTNVDVAEELNHEAKAWRDVWSAGHGTGAIQDVVSTETLIVRLTHELDAAQLAFQARRVPFSNPTAG